ncbi:class I SAM-dependent methyltransferase [Rhodobacter capsulatus]|uniref:class I SAM-dependent methyltransferase n=1 Tax=Rhodobacter capsulatus TaxID=1061 RepID=UPI00402979DD
MSNELTDTKFVIDRTIEEQVDIIRKPWENSPYYDSAEKWTFIFWDQDRKFKPYFDMLDTTAMLELSCGHGRHAEHSAKLAGKLTLVDIIPENVDFCRERLKGFDNISFELGKGTSFPNTADESLTAIYCYDAMVHFLPDIVEAYLKDTARVLKPGGRALYHHSNYSASNRLIKGGTPGARGYMTKDLFRELATSAKLNVLKQEIIDWGGHQDLDCISLLEKPC